jgi:Na+/H+ antiporter NhaD/arsenite permease-like protein
MALGACMGGNSTILASSAGIVAQAATEKTKYPIKFYEFLKVGLLSVFLTVGVGSIYLTIRFGVFG